METRSTSKTSSGRAVGALLLVTVLWGWTFVWMKQAVEASTSTLGERGLVAGVGLFMALRFGLAAVVVLALPGVRANLTRGAWRGGAIVGAALLVGFLLQMFGLGDVSPAVSAFLTSLYVLFTALLITLRAGRAPHPALLAGVLLATVGAALISVGARQSEVAGGNAAALRFGLGEALTVACAFVFAVHILVTDAWTKREAPLAITFTSFVAVAAGSTVTLAAGFALDDALTVAKLRELLAVRDFWQPLALSCVLATVLALTLMNLFQRELDPVRAAIVYAIEPVWAAVIAIGLGLEHPTVWLYLGGTALLAGNLVAEIVPPWLARRSAA